MMTLFFTIIFIAELIITFWIISGITTGIKWAKALNQNILEYRMVIINDLIEIKDKLKTANSNIGTFSGMVEKKRTDIVQIFSKDIITKLCFFLLNTNIKSVLTFIDIILSVRKFLKKK